MFPRKIALFFIIFIFSQLILLGQSSQNDFSLVSQIFNNWKNENNRMGYLCDTFYYLDKPKTSILDEIKQAINDSGVFIKRTYINSLRYSFDKDSVTLSNEEKIDIFSKIDSIKLGGWKNNLFPSSKMESNFQITTLLRQINESKDSIQKKMCWTYHCFIPPIFFRKDSFCIFYEGETNTLMDFGDCWLYQKTQNGWIKFAPVYRWFK